MLESSSFNSSSSSMTVSAAFVVLAEMSSLSECPDGVQLVGAGLRGDRDQSRDLGQGKVPDSNLWGRQSQ